MKGQQMKHCNHIFPNNPLNLAKIGSKQVANHEKYKYQRQYKQKTSIVSV